MSIRSELPLMINTVLTLKKGLGIIDCFGTVKGLNKGMLFCAAPADSLRFCYEFDTIDCLFFLPIDVGKLRVNEDFFAPKLGLADYSPVTSTKLSFFFLAEAMKLTACNFPLIFLADAGDYIGLGYFERLKRPIKPLKRDYFFIATGSSFLNNSVTSFIFSISCFFFRSSRSALMCSLLALS